jgi:hypothetical protein
MTNYRATLSFLQLPPLEFALFGHTHATKLTGHAVFTSPFYTAVQVETASQNLDDAIQAFDANHGDTEGITLRACLEELSGICKANAGYVTGKSAGNKDMIESGGFVASKERGQSEIPPYSVNYGKEPGKMILRCDLDKGDKAIVWLCFKGQTPPANMKSYSFLAALTSSEVEIGGLDSNSYYCFVAARVRSKNKGIVVFLDPIVKVVP